MLAVGALVLTATVSAVFGDRGYLEVRRYLSQKQELQAEIQTLEGEIRQLRREILELRSTSQAMERLAREELLLAKPGEVLFLYPNEPTKAEEAAGTGSSKADVPDSL